MTLPAMKDITLGQFTAVFVPAVVLLVWALMKPELGGDLDMGRTKLTIWATTILLIPALALYLFRELGPAVTNLAHLFWIAALAVFLAHAWWAIYVIFDGVADTFLRQGILIAGVNFLLLGLWVLDVLILLLVPARHQVPALQKLVRLLAFAVFAVTLVALRDGAVQLLGFVFVGGLTAAAVVRILVRSRTTLAAGETTSPGRQPEESLT